MPSDTLGPDNGGDSGSAYLETTPFGLQLPGPFGLRAGAGLAPSRKSWGYGILNGLSVSSALPYFRVPDSLSLA